MRFRTKAAIVLAIAGCGSAPAPAPQSPRPSRTSEPSPIASAEEEPASRGEEPLRPYVPAPDPPYVPPPATASQAPSDPDPPPDPSDVKACAARGGKMQRVCMMGALDCVIRYRDGGKRCSDGKECSGGKCVYEGRGPAPANGSGACVRDSDPCGCRALVIGGHVQPAMCTD